MTSNDAAYARATKILPGGVSSPVRAFKSVGGTPVFAASARGAYVTDVAGREYVDLVGSWGPALLGHAAPAVVSAVQQAAARGLSFGAPTEAEAELGELIQQRVPVAAKVRFVSTGTEACMTAVRLARGGTGRDLIVKFAGNYHGHSDALLSAAGSGLATAGLPGSAGVPVGAAADTLVLPYNDFDALAEVFTARGTDIAAVICEAAPANMGVVPPLPGFNVAIRAACDASGALMIVDEVLTGFRVAHGGWLEFEGGYTPDLVTFGKVVGGGMPLAALGGRADLMDLLAPLGPVYQAGTLSGNPLATAAGIATLTHALPAIYQQVHQSAQVIGDAVSAALSTAGVPHRVQWASSLFSVFFGADLQQAPVLDYTAAQRTDTAAYRAFFHAMLDAGILLPPSAFEAWFVSAAHDANALDRIVAALGPAARAAAQAAG